MSRLAAVAKGLYYRTQDPLALPLASLLTLPMEGTVNLLDPCVGAGVFLARLRDMWHPRATDVALTFYGIEPNHERATHARGVCQHVLEASYFHTRVSRESFQVAILNPPYDDDVEDGDDTAGGRERLESRFLRRTTTLLVTGGVLVLLVPHNQLRGLARHLAGQYRELRCFRLPDVAWAAPENPEQHPTPLYDQFHQVIVLGIKRGAPQPPMGAMLDTIEEWAQAGQDLPPLPLDPLVLAGIGTYPIPRAAQPVTEFTDPALALETLVAELNATGGGVWADPEYRARRWPDVDRLQLGPARPLGPLRVGHVITLAAIGLLNGRVLVGPHGRHLVVKGACRKETVTEQTTEIGPSGAQIHVTTATDRFRMALWAIDLGTGELLHIV